MAAKKDYYKILGVDKNADTNAIKKAYRKLAKKYHPDTNQEDSVANEKFKEVTEAYEILHDEEKRKLYDRFGTAAFDGSMGADPGGYQSYGGSEGYQSYRSPDGSYQEFHFEAGNMDDLFRDIFGSHFSQGQGSSSGSQYRQHSYCRKGADVTAKLEVTFEEAAFGGDQVISYHDGSGRMQSLQVHIPAGISSGKKIRLKGKGQEGMNGGEAGDLFLEISVKGKSGYERKGDDVYTTIQIPYTTAVLGGEVIVPTLYGDVSCKIKEGTQSGTKVRLAGKGIAHMSQPSRRGDQYVTIQIQVPRHLSEDARQKLREYRQAAGSAA